MNFEIKNIELLIMMFALLVSTLLFLNARKARKEAEKSVKIAESLKQQAEIEQLNTLPAIDILDLITVDDKHRVVLFLANMRSTPFRINSLLVEKKVYKKRTFKNYLTSKLDPNFDWNYNPIENYFWNPKGKFDNSEKYKDEAGEFLIVKESEKILVTIPDFKDYSTYRFTIKTSHGVISLAGSLSTSGRMLFCKEFRQSYS